MDLVCAVIAASNRRSNIPPSVTVALFALIGGVALLGWYFSKPQRIKRAIAAAQRWRIAELPDSTIGRIIGAAKPIGEPLTSPLGGRACIYYLAEVLTGGKHPKVIIREERSISCFLEDDSGRAIVDVEGAELVLSEDATTSSGTFDDATAVEAAFLARHGQRATGAFFNRSLIYRERTISIGETIAVVGAGVREPDPDAPPSEAYRGAPAMRLRLASTPRWKLRISDHPSTTA